MNPEPGPSPRPREQGDGFPVDLPGSQLIGGHPLRWTASVIAVATLVLALTDAIAVDGWAAELPPDPAVARLVEQTGRWRAMTDQAGLGATRAALHAEWKRWQAARLPGPDQR